MIIKYTDKKRIIFWLPTYKRTGGTIIVNLYSQLLIEKEIEVLILVIREKNKPVPDFWDKRIKFIYVDSFINHKLFILFFMLPFLFHYKKISHLISKNDIVISIYSPISFIIALFHLLGVIRKSYFIVHDNPTQKWIGFISFKFFIPLYIILFKESSIAFVNNLLKKHILFYKNKNFQEIPNSLTEYFINNHRTFTDKKLQLVYVGDVTRSKGFNVLMREVKILKNKLPYIKIVGFFSRKNALEKEISLLFDEYYFASNHKEIALKLKQSKFFFCTSPSESFCLPALEAMSSGCIIITTKTIGTSRYVIDENNGFFFNRKQKGDLTNSLFKILALDSKKQEMISSEAIKTAKEFSPDTMKEKFLEFLNL